MKKLTTDDTTPNYQALIPTYTGEERRIYKDQITRLVALIMFLDMAGLWWYEIDLTLLRRYLTDEGLKPYTITVYLAAIRARYAALLADRDHLMALLAASMPPDLSANDQADFINRALKRIKRAAKSSTARVKTPRPVKEHIWLTAQQVMAWLASIDVSRLIGLRDLALLALLFCTVIRDSKAVALVVDDLYHYLDGQPALRVPASHNSPARLVPYGEMRWVVKVIERWLSAANITEGRVFRGLTRGSVVSEQPLNARTVRKILDGYSMDIDGQPTQINGIDIRVSYARQLYLAGVDILIIQRNLGHETIKSTREYIGEVEPPSSAQNLPAIYTYDLTQLDYWPNG